MEINIIKDTPISKIEQDELNRKPLVNTICRSLIETSRKNHPCFCIGIYGKWGEGKTSFMNFIQEELLENGEKDNILIARYNPWMASNEESILWDFFNTISTDTRSDLKKILRQYGSIVSIGVDALASITDAAIDHGYLSRPTRNLIMSLFKRIRNWWNRSNDVMSTIDDKSLAQRKENISKAFAKSNQHLLIFIDDLDRLDKDEIHAVFRLIRQVADFDNVTYIVAMDPDIVAKSLGNYYGYENDIDGKSFIDKIIQLPIQLPMVPQSTIKEILINRIHPLWIQNECGTEETLEEICQRISSFLTTQRQIIRFINQLRFIIPALREEVNMSDLCYLITIKTLDNHAYLKIAEHKDDLFREANTVQLIIDQEKENSAVQNRYENALDDIVLLLKGHTKVLVRELLEELFLQNANNYLEDLNKKRICTEIYFYQYFILDVPKDQVSEHECNMMREKLKDDNSIDLIHWIEQVHEQYGYRELTRSIENILYKVSNYATRCQFSEKILLSLLKTHLCKAFKYDLFNYEDITRFMVDTLINRYMIKTHSEEQSIVYDEERIFSTLENLYSNSSFEFCLCFHSYEYSRININNCNYFKFFTSRLKEIKCQELIKYSKVILWPAFITWNNIDPEAPKLYLSEALKENSFNPKTLLEKLIDTKKDTIRDVNYFICVFKESCITLCEILKANGETIDTCKALGYIESNYERVMRDFVNDSSQSQNQE